MDSSAFPADSTPEELENWVAEFAERREAGEALDAEAFLREHPEGGTGLRRALAALGRTEALFPSSGDLPERIGEYRVRGEIGRGGMGRVFSVEREDRPGELFALKLLHLGLGSQPRAVHRFQREGKALERLRHPGIVRVFEAGVAGGTPYIVMEHVEGKSLAQVLEAARALAREDPTELPANALALAGPGNGHARAARVVARVARAVAAAHEEGVLHRDLKPSNVLLQAGGEPVLIDFGLMRLANSESLTGSGDAIGTPQYMAPEQARGERVDERADVFALGMILYELLTLRVPRTGEDAMSVLRRAGATPIRGPRRLDASVPRALDAITRQATSFFPRWRYTSAAQLADDLENHLAGRPIVARSPGPVRRAADIWLLHRRWLAAGAAALLFASLALSAWSLTRVDPEVVRNAARAEATAAWLAGDLEATRAHTTRMLEWDETGDEGRFLLAVAEGRPPAGGDDPVVRSLIRGQEERNAGRFEEAIRHFKAAVNITQRTHKSLLPRLFLGLALRDAGHWQQAAEFLSHTTTFLEERSPEIHQLLGQVYREGGELEGSIVALTTALNLDPADPSIWLDVTRTRYEHGDEAEALESAGKALELSRGGVSSELEVLATELEAKGRARPALDLRELLARPPRDQ